MGCAGSKVVIDANEVMKEANDHAKSHGATSLHFTKLQVSAMAEKFARLNHNEKSMTREQFRDVFNFDDESLDIMFEAFDVDHSGSLELSEMISGLSFFCRLALAKRERCASLCFMFILRLCLFAHTVFALQRHRVREAQIPV